MRVVRCEDDGAAFEPVESGIGAVDYTIMHIAGDRNCWGDLLSRWVTVPWVSGHASAVNAASEPDETLDETISSK